MEYLLNGFSTKMLEYRRKGHIVVFEDIKEKEFYEHREDAVSAIGHRELAEKYEVPLNRFNILLKQGDEAYIVTYRSGRKNAIDNSHYAPMYQRVSVIT